MHINRFSTSAIDTVGDLEPQFILDVGGHHFGALSREYAHKGRAHSRGAAGYQRNLARQSPCHFDFSLC
jgi:hypothetical protein